MFLVKCLNFNMLLLNMSAIIKNIKIDEFSRKILKYIQLYEKSTQQLNNQTIDKLKEQGQKNS